MDSLPPQPPLARAGPAVIASAIMLRQPVGIYINWAAYDELSDNIELTETVALRQLEEMIRLRRCGVQMDFYLMDAFWFAPDGAYRTWRQPHWPNGPDRWLDRCGEAGIRPGLWLTANTLCKLNPPAAWAGSSDPDSNGYCCFRGNFLAHYLETLQLWYDRGVRLFKFDFANFDAAPVAVKQALLPAEIRTANVTAWRGALAAFRAAHPDVVLIGYNGFEEFQCQYGTGAPLRKAVDLRWLDALDTLYCGDPRPADVPTMRFWRSKDVYSDHMVRYYLANNLPAARIDNSGFMVGLTGTCYRRGMAAWKGMLLLALARGGWANTYYGNLDLIDDASAAWFARAQSIYLPLQAAAEFVAFGAMPHSAEPYGFAFRDGANAVVTVVNPGQSVATLALPVAGTGRLLFRDAGFVPQLSAGQITLGPEQMAVIGFGRYTTASYDLGVQEDVVIPQSITPITHWAGKLHETSLTQTMSTPATGGVRLLFQQRDPGGPVRFSGGSPPNGTPLGQMLTITAMQVNRKLPTRIEYDKAIWSGLSWAVVEVDAAELDRTTPLTVTCATTDKRPVSLECRAYQVEY